MRMTDWEAGQAVRARLEPLGRTGLSIIYADKSKPMIAIKAAGFWLDGEMYDHAALAKNASETFKREAAIYEALGPHPHILNVWAQHTCEPERRQTQRRGKPGQCDSRGPPMLAVNLAETLPYIHDRGVIWGDISTRNILVFDDLHIKLSDFAGSSLRDVPIEDVFTKELFALGTGICEITEWAMPYGELEIEELQERLMKGEYRHLSEDNPAGSIIRKLWDSGYSSAKEAAGALREVSAQLNVITE